MAALFVSSVASAQYYSWGVDSPSLKWRKAKGDKVQVIYPDTASSYAARTLWGVEQVKPSIGYGFRHSALEIPFVIHPENFRSNGLVMYLPKRIEFLSSPAVESYAMPWYKQLVAHEYRHAVQYNNLNRGVIRVLSYLLGQQGSTVGLLFLPLWVIEGDATLMETQMSSFGRGLQPSFTMAYRALGREMLERKNSDKWFSGSYRDYIPDHYHIGYQIASYSDWRFGENIWDRVAYYGVRNPYAIATVWFALRRYYDTSSGKLFRETFEDLNRHWESLPEVESSAMPLKELPERDHTTYRYPTRLNDSTTLWLRSSLRYPERWVKMDVRSGEEQLLRHTGSLSSRPTFDGEYLYWTEYRRSPLFEERVGSRICYMEPQKGSRIRTLKGVRNALYVTATDRGLAWVEYTPDGSYTLRMRPTAGEEVRYPIPHFKEVHGLAWDNLTEAFYLLITNDDGMHIAAIDREGRYRAVTRPSYATLSALKARDGVLYFGSIQSGLDEAHALELTSGREYRLSSSRYGGFEPEPLNDSLVVMTDYCRRGYAPALQRYTHDHPVGYTPLPENRVNPTRRKWEVLNFDTVRFTAADSLRIAEKSPSKRYRKAAHLFKVHSWMPVALDPFELTDEQHLAVNWGVTVLSQNLLSNTEAFASWGWNRNEGSLYKLGFRYYGLGPTLDISANYGGNQQIYALEGQKTPSPERYYSVSASLMLPLYLQRGYHTRLLSLGAGWGYSNGLVAKLDMLQFGQNGVVSNIERIGFDEGLHKLAFTLGFSDQVRMAHRDFAPRWAYSLQADYALNPSNGNFSDLISLYGQAYLPGIVRPHSVKVALAYQTSLDGFKTPSGERVLTYRSARLIPHGYSSSDIQSNQYAAFAVSYQLPVWYPEGGISTILYFKRIRLNMGFDGARFLTRNDEGNPYYRHLYAYGGDILLDINLFRQPASATSTVSLSLYKPKDGKLWFGFGLGLPF